MYSSLFAKLATRSRRKYLSPRMRTKRTTRQCFFRSAVSLIYYIMRCTLSFFLERVFLYIISASCLFNHLYKNCYLYTRALLFHLYSGNIRHLNSLKKIMCRSMACSIRVDISIHCYRGKTYLLNEIFNYQLYSRPTCYRYCPNAIDGTVKAC